MTEIIFKPQTITVCTLEQALRLRRNNLTELARELGISRNTLRTHLDCSGQQLIRIDGDKLEYINKGWTK